MVFWMCFESHPNIWGIRIRIRWVIILFTRHKHSTQKWCVGYASRRKQNVRRQNHLNKDIVYHFFVINLWMLLLFCFDCIPVCSEFIISILFNEIS